MADKQIIDGIDVSGCEFFDECEVKPDWSDCLAHCSPYPEGACYGDCSEYPNCYYKQLKRKEQECYEYSKELARFQQEVVPKLRKRLRNKEQECIEKTNAIVALDGQLQTKEQECEELKEENAEIRKYQYEQDFLQQQLDQLKAEHSLLKDEYKILEDNLDSRTRDFEDVIDSYKQTLTEIEELMKIEIECKTYEIENDCFNETRCKALKEHIDFANEILQKISEVKNG